MTVMERLSVGGLTTCWEWKGAITGSGYGTISREGRTVLVHRLMWERFHGPIPSDKQIDHLCRNRKCANPRHLDLVTARENTLRGTGLSAVHALKTYCKNGHEFTPENTYTPPHRPRRRECRICKAELARVYQLARRALDSGERNA